MAYKILEFVLQPTGNKALAIIVSIFVKKNCFTYKRKQMDFFYLLRLRQFSIEKGRCSLPASAFCRFCQKFGKRPLAGREFQIY